jgi:UDP-N-acetylglucosamine diphosphorylase/glucosamine-1-phosphate N-acetyltransferase
MKNVILFDDDKWEQLLPLTYTRPIGNLRVGIDTINEKWARIYDAKVSYITKDYLSKKFPIHIAPGENLLIAGHLLPNPQVIMMIDNLSLNQAILYKDSLIAAKIDSGDIDKIKNNEDLFSIKGIDLSNNPEIVKSINSITDIFTKTSEFIHSDFASLTKGRISADLPKNNTLIGEKENLFIEKDANVQACILNTKTGPIYIGKNVTIMEGAMIRGPFSAMDNSVVKMGAKVYGPTSLGPYSVIGGEVNNVVIQGYSNKSHEGYLGNAVLGEWCNIGADTNASNLKNNYEEVKIWSYVTHKFEKTGLNKVGLIMGDHSKTGINTMLNTGSVLGVSCNIFGDGFPRTFIPSFSWGGASGYTTYKIDKALETARSMMKTRNISLDKEDEEILKAVYQYSAKYRTWDKKIPQD